MHVSYILLITSAVESLISSLYPSGKELYTSFLNSGYFFNKLYPNSNNLSKGPELKYI